jgi:hypothetical protein
LKLSLCSFTQSEIDWAAILDNDKEDQKKCPSHACDHGIFQNKKLIGISLWFVDGAAHSTLQFYCQKRNKKETLTSANALNLRLLYHNES